MEKEKLAELWGIYRAMGKDALVLNHYDLADATEERDPEIWKKFLMEPEVYNWRKVEQSVLQKSELTKLLAGISGSHSVGQAQIINALAKLDNSETIKEGPIFIYTYVPLSPEQEQAENVIKLDEDPFRK